MAIIKLEKAGDEATFAVSKCEVVESARITNRDGTPQEQVKFTSVNGDQLFIGREPADRALARIGFADGEQVLYGDVDGWTLRFYRVPNKNPAFKPYWNIDKAIDPEHSEKPRPAAAPAKAAPAAVPAGATPRQRLDAIDRAYAHAWAVAQKVQGEEAATPDSLQAGAATLLIAYGRDNLISQFIVAEKVAEPAKPAKPVPPPPPSFDDEPIQQNDDLDLPF